MIMVPMPIRLSLDATLHVDSPFGDATFNLSGPTDKDKDGEPEITLSIDLPGKAFDHTIKTELPIAMLVQSPAKIAKHMVEASPPFPLRAVVLGVLDFLDGVG